MRPATTRRRFIQASAAAATGTLLGDRSAFARRPDGPNLILIVIDSLRADAVYERAINTPNIDELLRQGIRFTSAYPEAMPTVPARNSILGGRRTFPFHGWHDYPGLLDSPGWSPLHDVERSLPATLRRAGWWTALRDRQPVPRLRRPVRAAAALRPQLRPHRRRDRRQPPDLERAPEGAAPLAAPGDLPGEAASASASTSPTAATGTTSARSFAAKVMTDAVRALEARRLAARRSR